VAQSNSLLTDIRLTVRHRALRPVYEFGIDQRRIPNKDFALQDVGTVTGIDNLAQAIILRLLTPLGELSDLAHPEYGSRLHELIGRQNTATVRNLAKLHILASLQMEPRIEKVLDVKVEPAKGARDRINVSLSVKPAGDAPTVTIGPFTLELQP
jgi:phage baseplate assembly protein W